VRTKVDDCAVVYGHLEAWLVGGENYILGFSPYSTGNYLMRIRTEIQRDVLHLRS